MKKNYLIILPAFVAVLLLTLYLIEIPSPSIEVKEIFNLQIK